MARPNHKIPAPYKSPIAITPGEILLDVIKERGIRQKDLAEKMGRNPAKISLIVNGTKAITAETAFQLELVLGIKSSFWLNAERQYQETKDRLERERVIAELQDNAEKIKLYPYNELAQYGVVPQTRRIVEKGLNLLKYFGYASFEALEKHTNDIVNQPIAAHRSYATDVQIEKLAVWIRMGEIRAEQLKLKNYNREKFESKLNAIRDLTKLEPHEYCGRLTQIGEECGVAFLFIPEFKGFPFYAITRWVKKTPYIQVGLRGKRNDYFWFAIFHEICHILNHPPDRIYLQMKNKEDDLDNEANRFAHETLIDPEMYESLKASLPISKSRIIESAREMNIHPGILLGSLQHDRMVDYSYFQGLFQGLGWGEGGNIM
jgi:HTH-type transcriptional regulator / antitoxin HigA